jgi:hypothetical protein
MGVVLQANTGSRKNQLTSGMASAVTSSAGPRPPNQAQRMTAAKKKMKTLGARNERKASDTASASAAP